MHGHALIEVCFCGTLTHNMCTHLPHTCSKDTMPLAATHAHTPTPTAHSTALTLHECPAARRASTANYCYCYCHTIRHKPEPCSVKHGQLHKQTLHAISTPPSCPFHTAESINREINGALRCAQSSTNTTQHKPCYAAPAGSLQHSWGPRGSRLAAAALTSTPPPCCLYRRQACMHIGMPPQQRKRSTQSLWVPAARVSRCQGVSLPR